MSQQQQQEEYREERERERDAQLHRAALQRRNGNDAPETLKYVSEPDDIDSPSDALAWINSKSSSTTKLSGDDVHSNEWVMEYFQLLARMQQPPHYGLTGHRRAWAHGDYEAYRTPLVPGNKLDFEGFAELGKLNQKKSQDGWGVETSTRDTTESIMRKDEADGGGGGGLLGRIRNR